MYQEIIKVQKAKRNTIPSKNVSTPASGGRSYVKLVKLRGSRIAEDVAAERIHAVAAGHKTTRNGGILGSTSRNERSKALIHTSPKGSTMHDT